MPVLLSTLHFVRQLLRASMFCSHTCARQMRFRVPEMRSDRLSLSALFARHLSRVDQHCDDQTIDSRLMCWSCGDAMPFIVYRRCTRIT